MKGLDELDEAEIAAAVGLLAATYYDLPEAATLVQRLENPRATLVCVTGLLSGVLHGLDEKSEGAGREWLSRLAMWVST